MKVWIYGAVIDKAYKYFHVFTGVKINEDPGYVYIDKSLIEFGNHSIKQHFQKSGEKTFIGEIAIKDGEYDLQKNIVPFIVKGIFEGDFILENKSFKIRSIK